jgi:peptidoglycan hydrolase CwlO-like protein
MYEKLKADFEAQKAQFSKMEEDFQKFLEGNASAGKRIRKSQQEIKHLAQEIRVEIQNIKNQS